MLVLTVRTDDKLILHRNGQILARVLAVDIAGKARIGFEADKSISIDRESVYLRKYPPAENLYLEKAVEA